MEPINYKRLTAEELANVFSVYKKELRTARNSEDEFIQPSKVDGSVTEWEYKDFVFSYNREEGKHSGKIDVRLLIDETPEIQLDLSKSVEPLKDIVYALRHQHIKTNKTKTRKKKESVLETVIEFNETDEHDEPAPVVFASEN